MNTPSHKQTTLHPNGTSLSLFEIISLRNPQRCNPTGGSGQQRGIHAISKRLSGTSRSTRAIIGYCFSNGKVGSSSTYSSLWGYARPLGSSICLLKRCIGFLRHYINGTRHITLTIFSSVCLRAPRSPRSLLNSTMSSTNLDSQRRRKWMCLDSSASPISQLHNSNQTAHPLCKPGRLTKACRAERFCSRYR
jgi:hypothetical protein